MNELYWLTRLDGIADFSGLCEFFGILGTIIGIVCAIIGKLKDTDWDDYSIPRYIGKIFLKIFPFVFGIGIIIDVFVPTTKEALIIYGVGGSLDYIKADSTAQQLPKKVIEACDIYLDEILNGE